MNHKQYLIEKTKIVLAQEIPLFKLEEDPIVTMNYAARSIVLILKKEVAKSTKTNCQKSEITEVFVHEEDFVPVGFWSYLRKALGLKFVSKRAVTKTVTFNIINHITVIEKYCPHYSFPNSNLHSQFLIRDES